MQAFGELKLTSPYITGMNASVLRTQLIKKVQKIFVMRSYLEENMV